MRRITYLFVGLLGGMTALWALSVTVPETASFFAVRGVAVDATGILAMAVMSAAMILAARPVVLETATGGLDKGYRLHKWLGIAGLVLAVTHWLWAQGPKWAVGLGLLARPERGPRPEAASEVEAVLRSLRGVAEGVGEWAFYAAALLIVLALIKLVPYRWFQRLHRVFPVAYLVLVFHAVVLMPIAFWTAPVGPPVALLMIGGSIAAVMSLFGLIGRRRETTGSVETVTPREGGVVEVSVRLCDAGRWPGHKAGQFAFVTFDKREGGHPFTISSAWTGDGRLRFLIKALGDHTTDLSRSLTAGASVMVEGPYGRFVFDQGRSRQLWVAGGIGVTPFLARLEALASGGAGEKDADAPVDLIYSDKAPDPAILDRLRSLAPAAGVRLHLMKDSVDGVLTGERLRAMVPDWARTEVWFCGPEGFAQALRRDLGPDVPLHRELFSMR